MERSEGGWEGGQGGVELGVELCGDGAWGWREG